MLNEQDKIQDPTSTAPNENTGGPSSPLFVAHYLCLIGAVEQMVAEGRDHYYLSFVRALLVNTLMTFETPAPVGDDDDSHLGDFIEDNNLTHDSESSTSYKK